VITLEILGSTVKVSGEVPRKVEQDLIKECRFMKEGAQYAPSFQTGEWDGYTYLYRWRKFPIGLLERVETSLALGGEEYEVYDFRETEEAKPFVPLTPLREYQKPIVDTAVEKGNGLYQAPTGSGKTIMVIHIMARLGYPSMVIVPTIDLVDQTLEAMKEHGGVYAVHATSGWLYGFNDVNWDAREAPLWAVATWQTIHSVITNNKRTEYKKPKKPPCKECGTVEDKHDDDEEDHAFKAMTDNDLRKRHTQQEKMKKVRRDLLKKRFSLFDTVVVDEAAYLGAKAVFTAVEWFPARHRFGVSATPWRGDNAGLQMFAAVGELSAGLTPSELIRLGYLVKPIIKFVEAPRVKCSDYKKWQTVYKEGVVENTERNILLAEEAANLSKEGRITLVMVQQILHGNIIKRYIEDIVGKGEVFFVNGKLTKKKRKEFTERFHNGEVPIAISSSVWNIGVDHPILSGLVLAGPYKSQATNVQRIGRGLRLYDGKKDVKVIDTWDNMPYLRDWSLERHDIYREEEEFVVER
jgi:superfamily II DNA or RNA helicase